MNTCFKVFASYNILQCLCDFIHVLIFVTISKCRKSPKLMNIVMIGWKCWGRSTSHYTRAWGSKGPWKFEWMINLRGVSHGLQWMAFHGLPDFVSTQKEGYTIYECISYPFNEHMLRLLHDCCWFISMGASTVKCTALDPCSGLSESDPKLYTNFEFYDINLWIFINI